MNMEKEILGMLKEIKSTLNEHSRILNEHSQILNEHSQKFKEHGQILGALKVGQEGLKAEMSELRLQNAKDFGVVKEQIKTLEDSIEILKDETWTNKKDIRRVQRTMGMI
ncbi:hypothetical protein [Lederbergia lenta]|uniref:Uncharacterized protein n=1 Tax=Lederbergia lenta TaxID=1467 RepID=A0A2X4YW82_LEDLE|nr:hypothetical protein [Lederbergia lenta]MCM3112526.1 hypothetical protein [Lederbergia lenta]MEC2323562.1 hypothetical protein [Lederbergia lenta]SQI52594.1 Uncharacterised protein [Lederbergia lenta]